MSALPNEMPQNAKVDPVTRFKSAYRLALAEAQVSIDHTATEGWQRLYADHFKLLRDRRQEIAGQLRVLADQMERRGLTDDDEKALGDIKKASIELNAAHEHFLRQAVDPVKAPITACQDMLVEAMNEARRIEEREPMLNVGLVELMREAVAVAQKVVWSDENGTASDVV
jgi:hypothetical protein